MISTASPGYRISSPIAAQKCSSESAGLGTSGAKIGNAHLKWAFSEAAVLFLRDHPASAWPRPPGEKHDKGSALTILAQKLARAVYYMLTRKVADTETFFQREGGGAEEPEALLGQPRNAPQRGAQYGVMPASVNATKCLGVTIP